MYGKLVCMYVYICMYGKFKFSELALRIKSPLQREPWTETSHMYSLLFPSLL